MNLTKEGQLSRVVVKGFKSIKECDIERRDINVLIGSNGVGKVTLFQFLRCSKKY